MPLQDDLVLEETGIGCSSVTGLRWGLTDLNDSSLWRQGVVTLEHVHCEGFSKKCVFCSWF